MEAQIDGFTILFDAEDEPTILAHTWRFRGSNGKRYLTRSYKVNGVTKHERFHRRIMGASYGDGRTVDHANGDTRDNRRSNLRFVTVLQNNQNIVRPKSTSKSGILGVNWHKKTKKWRVQLRMDGATIHVGYFHDMAEAAEAYRAKKQELHPHWHG